MTAATQTAVDVFEFMDGPAIERGVSMEGIVPDYEREDARYNLERYGSYWLYGGLKRPVGTEAPRSSAILLRRA